MEQTNWKKGWRLWSPRSYAEAIDTRTGDRLLMRISHRGRGISYERFGPNVGQPNPAPPIHPLHQDLPELVGGLRLGCWTLDGCYELELDRPEVKLRLILSDSRSLACGPTEDPLIRQGVLLGQVECSRLAENISLSFEAVAAADGGPVTVAVVEGPGVVQAERLQVQQGTTLFVVGRMTHPMLPGKAKKRIRQMTSYVQHFGNTQLNGPHRMGHAVRWNLCYDFDQSDIFLPVSRSWVQMMAQIVKLPDYRRGPMCSTWPATLSSLLVARSEPNLGRAIVRSLLTRQQEDGRLPPFFLGPHVSNRSALPLVPLAVWYLCHDSRPDFAAEVFPQLARAHRWLMDHREPNHDGLLSWGSDREKRSPLDLDGWVGAHYESGMDSSPMWQDLGFSEETQTLGRACIDLCALAALSARVLAALARITDNDARPFEEDFRRIYRAVNSQLWSGDGLYHNMRLDGSLSPHITPTSLYPLTAGLTPKDRSTAMVKWHLRNRETFWGHPVIPSIARNSPHYNGDGDGWSGRVWPPMNYLVWAGLRLSYPLEASHLAQHCRDLFEDEWEKGRHVHESYSAKTGLGEPEGGNYARSAPLHCWGGLLLLPDHEGKVGGAIARLPHIKLD